MTGLRVAKPSLQEVYLEASEALADYLREPKMPFYLWLRALTCNKLLELHRRHLGTQNSSIVFPGYQLNSKNFLTFIS